MPKTLREETMGKGIVLDKVGFSLRVVTSSSQPFSLTYASTIEDD